MKTNILLLFLFCFSIFTKAQHTCYMICDVDTGMSLNQIKNIASDNFKKIKKTTESFVETAYDKYFEYSSYAHFKGKYSNTSVFCFNNNTIDDLTGTLQYSSLNDLIESDNIINTITSIFIEQQKNTNCFFVLKWEYKKQKYEILFLKKTKQNK